MKTTQIFLVTLLVLAGCTTFHGLAAKEPEAGSPLYPARISNRQPTLRWEASNEPNATYDLIVFEGVRAGDNGLVYVPGRIVYQRESLPAAEHHLEEPLEPEGHYLWSVRVHRTGKPDPWSTYDYRSEMGVAWTRAHNAMYHFQVTQRDPAAIQ